ncbi:hypothetical protein PYW07_013350 [Mythimna separata]|uniref:NACHT domain-containing protein n=1 Tax=Mythimna separata TaxID=271217 RepID=A0AAD7Y636_MYTSE|nr:hypothetical protein PYW07_013350 [Mythimna separata]
MANSKETESKKTDSRKDDSKKTDSKKYPKRGGTSGIRGQLYETKLLSLIYFRAIHDDNIEEIYLATNVDNVGSFDDICLRVKLKGIKKPMTVFIQAKHRENSNTVLTLNKSDLADYFNSYLEIRSKFKPTADDVLFNGELDETECLFVIYTTAKGDKKSKKYEGSLADHLDALIGTGDPGSQPSHDAEHVDLLCDIVLEEQMTALARLMVKCVYGEFSDNEMKMLMNKELLIKYHVILAQKVFVVADIEPEGHRNASFRKEFFQIDGEYLRIFKDELCTEILKRRNRDNPTESNNLLESLILLRKITDPETLYKEVGSRFIYKNGKFVLLDKSSQAYYGIFLDKINESQENILKTVELAVKECFTQLSQKSIAGLKLDSVTVDFSKLKFKVPASFGNKDLSIKGSDVKVERKLDDLYSKFVSFIEKAKPNNIITIDDSLGEGFLKLSGGIASAVGNLLVSDKSSQLLKFNEDETLLGNLGKKLYCKLKEKYPDLAQYKFDVQAKVFPKLSITTDEYTRKVVSDFLSTLIFYTSQYNEKNVEETLKYEININQSDEVKHVEVTSDAIFLKYHDAIQKWSMTTEAGKGKYLEKEGSLYKKAAILSRNQPLISVINMMQRIKNKNYDFREETVNIKLDELVSGTIIDTDNKELTLAKLTKQLNNRDSAVLDFEYIINLSPRDDKALRTELMDSKEVKTLIVVFDSTLIDINSNRKLLNVASSMKNKRVIIITDQKSVEKAKEIFSTGKVIKDEKNRLIDMTKETRDSILATTKVIFQGDEVTLGEILFNNSIEDVSGDVIYKIMHSNQNYIGKPIINPDYKPELYVQRSVRQYFRDKFKPEKREAAGSSRSMSGGDKRSGYEKGDRRYLKTLYDLLDAHENNVLLIGDPGMGKSTLLTHLTFKTKESWSKPGWIVRVNLLEHTKQFSEWKVDKTDINALQCFRFLCQAALSKESDTLSRINITLVESNNTIYVKDFKGDEWTLFELKVFLNFYNSTETLIILFDGFDEICPNYANEVLKLIKAVKQFCRKHKMWITSRSYNRMNTILELQFDTLFEIEPLEGREQHLYLNTLWDERKILKNLDEGHLKNIDGFIRFMSQYTNEIRFLLKKCEISPSKTVNRQFFLVNLGKEIPLIIVYLSFIKYLKSNLSFALSSVMDALNSLFNECYHSKLFENEFVASPLHLNILVDYFHNKIKGFNLSPTTWSKANESFDMYKHFLETKLKRIRYQDKTQNDMTKPDNVLAYKRDFAEFMDKHKKLAAYAIYGKCLFDSNGLEQLNKMIHELKEGEERTGIICNVLDDIPIFVHSTLKEYFAVEFICDLLKREDNQAFLWDYILNEMFFNCNKNVLTTFDDKMKLDVELSIAVKRSRKLIFDLLLKQSRNKNGEIRSTLCEAIRHDMKHFVRILFYTVIDGNLDKNNLMDFIKIVKETNMLIVAVKMDLVEPISCIIRAVTKVDKTKLITLFENIKKLDTKDIDSACVSDYIQMIHQHVWTRMDIVPDWENLSELSGQIYFI